MRRVAISLLSVLFLACNKNEPSQAGVQVLVNYTASFKAGCFVVKSMDAANPAVELDRNEIADLANKVPPLKIAVLRKQEWPETVRVVVTAHEQRCENGARVDEDSADVDLSGAGFQAGKTVTLTLETPDADGDGFVPTANGGTDCNDESGEARPNGPAEICDGLDNDCQGGIDNGLARTEFFFDEDGDGVGMGPPVLACTTPPRHAVIGGDCDDKNPARAPNKPEVCNDFDDDCDEVTDEGFNKAWYADRDGDTYGAQSMPLMSCAALVPGHVRVTGSTFDCDDDKPDVNPGATEKCNDRDDNCVGGADETFLVGAQPKGSNCLNDVCVGVFICDPANDTRTVCNALPPTLYYPDVDQDTQGASDGAVQKVCSGTPAPPGKVTNATDCDDADPGTKQAATEVCDGLDNNCNGQLDEGLTCGGRFLQVGDTALGINSHDWRTVALDPTDGYPVWVAGLNGKLAVRKMPTETFVSHSHGEVSTSCGNSHWYAAWVRPLDGHVFLAGQGGQVAEHTGANCINQSVAAGAADTTGIVGFVSGGETTLYLTSEGGKLFTWVPGTTPVERNSNSGNSYRDIHAVDPGLLLVAGRTVVGAGNQIVTSYVNGNWTPVPHTLSNPFNGSVNALWMGSANLACAVGDGGAVWRWSGGTSWTLAPAVPGGGSPNFSSVVIPPSTNVAYMVDKSANGKLRRLTQYGWARAPRVLSASTSMPIDPDVPLYDLAMRSVGDFWMVGDDGRVYHYPQP